MFKQLIRSPAARRRVTLLVALVLLLPFIIFFSSSGALQPAGPGGAAGKLFGRRVPWEVFETNRRWLRAQLGELPPLPPEVLDAWLVRQTWDRLAVLEEARRRRVRVSDAELRAAIRQIPALQDDGRFVPERYDAYLASISASPQQFEALVRSQLTMAKLVETLRRRVTLSDEELRAAVREERERLQARAFIFDAAAYRAAAEAALTEEALRAHYDAHPEEVQTPEAMTFDYVGITRDEIAAGVRPSDEDLQAYYAAHQDAFLKDGQLRLFEEVAAEVRAGVIEEQVRRRLAARAVELEEALRQGAPLEELAAAQRLAVTAGGRILVDEPWRSAAPAALTQALAGLREGQLSGLIETETGLYVGRVRQRTPPAVPPFDAAREQVRERLLADRAREAARDAAGAFRARIDERVHASWRMEEALLQEPAGTVVELARAAQTIDPPGIAAPEAVRAAFAAPLGSLTEAIPTDTGAVVLLPVTRSTPDEVQIAQAMEASRAAVVNRKQQETLERWLDELRARAQIESYVDRPSG